MNVFLLLFLLFAIVNTAPVVEVEGKNNTEENEVVGESRAGIVDTLNPFNKESSSPPPNKNKDNEGNPSPLAGVQNLFTNNPFAQLFSSSAGGNFLNDVKVFLVGTQGMVFPASAILGGFQNLVQGAGNLGNFLQGAQNLVPPLSGN